MIFTAWSDGGFDLAGRWVRCALGRSGVAPAQDKREGDGCSPLGLWPLRRLLYRADRLACPLTALSASPIAPDDGWCDSPGDAAYNRPVKRPYGASSEAMWRADGLYDLVLVLGHNDDPPRFGLGSAIFLHIAKDDYAPTEGCVALARDDLLALLALAGPRDALAIRQR